MPNPVQIDHVVIAGSDLQAMRDDLAAVGFPSVEGGVHADGLTHNALIVFRDGSYLELIAPVPGKTPVDHYWWPFMQDNAGVCAWAIRSQDLEADSAFYRSLGITVSEPKFGGRKRLDGTQLEWRTAALTDKPLGTVFPFLIQDVTPRELRVSVANAAYGVVTGIESVLLNLAWGGLDADIKNVTKHLAERIEVDSIYWDTREEGLSGVLLGTTNIDAAIKNHNVNGNIFNDRIQFSAWVDTKCALIGFRR